MDNGQRWEKCELSSIDTSLLLGGILTAGAEIQDLRCARKGPLG
jgi:hypothetical protein